VGNRATARSDTLARADDDGRTEFAELRSLIVGPEQRQLHALQARLDDRGAQAREVSQVLPEAVLLRTHDPLLTRALAPTVEEAITASVRRNPRPLADALFPVIGPAIRKAIAASLSAMLESLNRTLGHSLSWRAVKWRITALRTGKSFAEVVLLNTLVYRVEQVFLIDRRSGLLLHHLQSGTGGVQDADMVSGMLTAIRDFARDSFRVSEEEALETLQIGDLTVWIEQGPYALLAVVIRGTAPPGLRVTMQETLERVHAFHGDALRDFNGDTAALEAAQPMLEGCLLAQYQPDDRRGSVALWAVTGALVVLAAAWMFFALSARARWNGYLASLRAEPGIVVVSAGRQDGRYLVAGLRDPLARDPRTLLPQHELSDATVAGSWQLYQSLEPSFVLARARQVLRPPSSVSLELMDGVLKADGTASAEWIASSAALAPALAGVARYDASAALESALRRVRGQLEAVSVLFVRGSATPVSGAESTLAGALDRVRELEALARVGGSRFRIEVVGHADSDGPPESNVPLSVSRADRVRAALEALRLHSIEVTSTGVGSREPKSAGTSEADKQENRRVSFRVLPAGGAQQSGDR
jgi:OOP family OmpA-OmpF porin